MFLLQVKNPIVKMTFFNNPVVDFHKGVLNFNTEVVNFNEASNAENGVCLMGVAMGAGEVWTLCVLPYLGSNPGNNPFLW